MQWKAAISLLGSEALATAWLVDFETRKLDKGNTAAQGNKNRSSKIWVHKFIAHSFLCAVINFMYSQPISATQHPFAVTALTATFSILFL